jgi:hypothetical protein
MSMASLILQGVITEDGKLEVELPEGMTPGAVEVEIREPEFEYKPLGDLLNTELVGLWADREDITDNIAFSDELRKRASRRSQP